MSFVSLEFLVFVVVVAAVYFVLPAKMQWIWLLLASGAFYYTNSSWYQVLNLICFLVINYLAAIIMSRQTIKRKAILVCVLVFDIAYLLFFKYFSLFEPLVKGILASEDRLALLNHLINRLSPVGISYIALIVIGYMIDLYWENISVQRNLGKFALVSIFFPQVVSGPIVKYKEYEGNLFDVKHEFSYDRVVSGIERIIWGVFKKLVISSRAGIVANTIKDSYQVYTGFYVPVGVAFFIIQLYTDFSGLMDIVIGTAEIFGISMPENFNSPFYSESISEFWRRWHITLGRFLKDYVLFPMQMSGWLRKLRKKYKKIVGKEFEKRVNLPRYLTMLISWIIIGAWHGASFNYIFGVGIYMWLVIIAGELLQPAFEKAVKLLNINTDCFSWHFFRRIRTLLLYMFGVSFFWMDSIKDGIELWKGMLFEFNPWIFVDKSLYSLGLIREEMLILLAGVGLLTFVSYIQKNERVRDVLNRQNYFFRVLVYFGLIALTICFGHYGSGFDAASFIYGKF